METIAPQVQQLEVTQTDAKRFVIEVPKGDDKFIFSCPASATYQETFNVVMQVLLSVYDMSKQVPQPPVGDKKDE